MTKDVDNTDRVDAWPANQWHPAYDSVTDWLDAEGGEPTLPKPKPRNTGKHGPAVRGTNEK